MDSLFAAEHAVPVHCRTCGRVIDLWFEHGIVFDRQGMRRGDHQALCPECLLATLPVAERERWVRTDAEARSIAREAGIPPSVTSYLFECEGRPGSWSDGFLAVGYAVHIAGWDRNAVLRQPYVTVDPDDPQAPEFSLVFFAGLVIHRDVRVAMLKCIWPFDDLSRPERVEIVNRRDPVLRAADRALLERGLGFWDASFDRRGRRPGIATGPYDAGEAGNAQFRENLERVLTDHERRGVRIASQEMLADFMPVGKTTLNVLFNRVPQARERFKQHKRGVPKPLPDEFPPRRNSAN